MNNKEEVDLKEQIKLIKNLIDKLEDVNSNKNLGPGSKIFEHFLVEPLNNSKVISKIDDYVWHSVQGRVFGIAIEKFDEYIRQSLVFICGLNITNWIQYEISLTDLQGQAHATAMAITFGISIIYILMSTVLDLYIHKKMGNSDSIFGKSKLDLINENVSNKILYYNHFKSS